MRGALARLDRVWSGSGIASEYFHPFIRDLEPRELECGEVFERADLLQYSNSSPPCRLIEVCGGDLE